MDQMAQIYQSMVRTGQTVQTAQTAQTAQTGQTAQTECQHSKSETIKNQLKSSVMKLILDITQIKSKILMENDVDESNKDLQFIALLLEKYSEKKEEIYGEKLFYKLDVETNSRSNSNYNTLNDFAGKDIFSFLKNGMADETADETVDKSVDKSSSYESLSDTASDYEFGENELSENVNQKMAIVQIDLHRSILSRGIEINDDNYICENIVLVDNNNSIVDKY